MDFVDKSLLTSSYVSAAARCHDALADGPAGLWPFTHLHWDPHAVPHTRDILTARPKIASPQCDNQASQLFQVVVSDTIEPAISCVAMQGHIWIPSPHLPTSASTMQNLLAGGNSV